MVDILAVCWAIGLVKAADVVCWAVGAWADRNEADGVDAEDA